MENVKIILDKLKLLEELQSIYDLVPFSMDEEHERLKARIVQLMAFINQVKPEGNNSFYPRPNIRRN